MKIQSHVAAIALVAVAAMGVANAASATTVTGAIFFNGGSTNYYDPGNGFVPAGYGNAASSTVTVGPGVEFGFSDGSNQDTADFTATSLDIQDVVLSGAANWTQTFTASTPGFFNGINLVSDTLGGVTYGVTGDTLTVNWGGFAFPMTGDADFTFGGVPEPTTWAMMLIGFGGIGGAVRLARRKQAAVAA